MLEVLAAPHQRSAAASSSRGDEPSLVLGFAECAGALEAAVGRRGARSEQRRRVPTFRFESANRLAHEILDGRERCVRSTVGGCHSHHLALTFVGALIRRIDKPRGIRTDGCGGATLLHEQHAPASEVCDRRKLAFHSGNRCERVHLGRLSLTLVSDGGIERAVP